MCASRKSNDFMHLVKLAKLDPKCHFRYGNWAGVSFKNCDLTGFDFTGSDLTDTDFSGARVDAASFEHALLAGSNLEEVCNLSKPLYSTPLNPGVSIQVPPVQAPQKLVLPAANIRGGTRGLRRATTHSRKVDYGHKSHDGKQESQASRFFLPEEEPIRRSSAPKPELSSTLLPPPQGADYRLHPDWMRYSPPEKQARDHVEAYEPDDDFFANEDEFGQEEVPATKRSRVRLMAAVFAAGVMVGVIGTFLYHAMDSALGTSPVSADNRPLKGETEFANGRKNIFDRLTPDGQQIQTMAYTPPIPAAAPAAQPAAGNSLEGRIDEALRRRQQASEALQPGATPQVRVADQPTVVRSESYRPDGTRIDTPTIVDVNGGQLPPPFGTATQTIAPPQSQVAAPFRTVTSSPSPVPTSRSASLSLEPPATPSGGYWVSLKSDPNENAIRIELPNLQESYKSVLGDVQLSSIKTDLGGKGVTYRAVAGPLTSRQEAIELCEKIKRIGGSKACFRSQIRVTAPNVFPFTSRVFFASLID